MKLADYLEAYSIPKGEFARRIGVTGAAVTGYCNGNHWPGREKMEAIVAATDGAVTANDFLQMEAAE